MSERRRLMIANAGIAPVTGGLILHLDALNNTGAGRMDPTATTWVDLVGGNNIPLDLGYVSWQNGMCLQTRDNYRPRSQNDVFESVSGGGYSIEGVVKYSDTATSWIFALRNNTNAPNMQVAWNSAGKSVYYCFGPGNESTTLIDRSVGSIMTTVSNGGLLSIYLNGELINTVQDSARTARRPYPQYLGLFYQPWASGGSHAGSGIYAIRIYDRTLSAREVAHNYACNRARYGI